jgi:hypothetical protein
MNPKIQFRIEKRTSNESGIINVREIHYPLYWKSLLLVQNLSPIVDYTLICIEQNTYNLDPNTEYFFLILIEN